MITSHPTQDYSFVLHGTLYGERFLCNVVLTSISLLSLKYSPNPAKLLFLQSPPRRPQLQQQLFLTEIYFYNIYYWNKSENILISKSVTAPQFLLKSKINLCRMAASLGSGNGPWGSVNCREFIDNLKTLCFLGMNLLHGVSLFVWLFLC
jgi:hypothetical protein